jgi:hypothetical protein
MPEQVKTCILCGEMPERFAGFAAGSEMEAAGRATLLKMTPGE